jgi:hypothetical protein
MRRADHTSKDIQESYRLWVDQETEKGPGPARAVEPFKKKKKKKKKKE